MKTPDKNDPAEKTPNLRIQLAVEGPNVKAELDRLEREYKEQASEWWRKEVAEGRLRVDESYEILPPNARIIFAVREALGMKWPPQDVIALLEKILGELRLLAPPESTPPDHPV